MSDEDDDDNLGDNFGIQDEYNAQDRAGNDADMLMNSLKNIKYRDRNSTEQFYTLVRAVFYKLMDLEIKFMSQEDIEYIVEYINDMEKPGYKNATAYILGYYVYNNRSNFKIICDYLPYIKSIGDSYPIFIS